MIKMYEINYGNMLLLSRCLIQLVSRVIASLWTVSGSVPNELRGWVDENFVFDFYVSLCFSPFALLRLLAIPYHTGNSTTSPRRLPLISPAKDWMNSTSTSNSFSTPSVLPRDARLIALLLAANGAEDCEEGVVRMLVEFAHRSSLPLLLSLSLLSQADEIRVNRIYKWYFDGFITLRWTCEID